MWFLIVFFRQSYCYFISPLFLLYLSPSLSLINGPVSHFSIQIACILLVPSLSLFLHAWSPLTLLVPTITHSQFWRLGGKNYRLGRECSVYLSGSWYLTQYDLYCSLHFPFNFMISVFFTAKEYSIVYKHHTTFSIFVHKLEDI